MLVSIACRQGSGIHWAVQVVCLASHAPPALATLLPASPSEGSVDTDEIQLEHDEDREPRVADTEVGMGRPAGSLEATDRVESLAARLEPRRAAQGSVESVCSVTYHVAPVRQ